MHAKLLLAPQGLDNIIVGVNWNQIRSAISPGNQAIGQHIKHRPPLGNGRDPVIFLKGTASGDERTQLTWQRKWWAKHDSNRSGIARTFDCGARWGKRIRVRGRKLATDGLWAGLQTHNCRPVLAASALLAARHRDTGDAMRHLRFPGLLRRALHAPSRGTSPDRANCVLAHARGNVAGIALGLDAMFLSSTLNVCERVDKTILRSLQKIMVRAASALRTKTPVRTPVLVDGPASSDRPHNHYQHAHRWAGRQLRSQLSHRSCPGAQG